METATLMEIKIHKNAWYWGVSFTYIVNGGECILRASIVDTEPGELFIDGLSTMPDCRRHGLASAAIEKAAADHPGLTLVIWVDKDKPENIRFYEKRGFVKVEDIDEHLVEMHRG